MMLSAAGLQGLPTRQEVAMVFHAAALCDFRIKEVTNENGEPVHDHKAPSRSGLLKLTLEPAPKVIASLRRMFPSSIIVSAGNMNSMAPLPASWPRAASRWRNA